MTKLRESARGQPCMIRIPGVCNGDPATTVLCHLPGGGMGKKQPDLLAAFGCSSCHNVVDGRESVNLYNETSLEDHLQLKIYFFDGVIRTQQYWLDNGYLELP